jgi:hypothetical protein
MLRYRLTLLQLVCGLLCCLLLTPAVSRSIQHIDLPELFKKHSVHADLGDALRLLKGRILRLGDGEDHLEFAVQLYKLGRTPDALAEFRWLPHYLSALRSRAMQRRGGAQSWGCSCSSLAR